MASSTKKLTLEEIQKARNEYLLARRQRAGALKADIAMPDGVHHAEYYPLYVHIRWPGPHGQFRNP
jgi:hypothetical protein